ncbi:hypothetical protein C8J56DRAFT_933619 [Mycena floridula]|nr:hypothetical protein C8J56DRAFT_933619 [Mycena floridula]
MSTGNNNGQFSGRGASYFYGFLITFVGLLLIFLSCGLGSRRRLRERSFIEGWPGADALLSNPKEEPKLWEPELDPCPSDGLWDNIMPLALQLNRTAKNLVAVPDVVAPWTSRNPQALHGLSLPRAPLKPRALPSQASSLPPNLQIAVLIAMPVQQHHSGTRHSSYQLGVVHIPWKEESVT